jgi:hypothetical protein
MPWWGWALSCIPVAFALAFLGWAMLYLAAETDAKVEEYFANLRKQDLEKENI